MPAYVHALISSSEIVRLTNIERLNASIVSFTRNPQLAAAAKIKAEDMAGRGYFSHTTPEGDKTWSLIKAQGYEFSRVGENLAVKFTDSTNVIGSWLASPGHRANLLNEKFKDIGVGIAEGMYQGATTTFVVALFGAPMGDMHDESETSIEISNEDATYVSESAGLMAALQPEEETNLEDASLALPSELPEVPKAQVAAAKEALTQLSNVATIASEQMKEETKNAWIWNMVNHMVISMTRLLSLVINASSR